MDKEQQKDFILHGNLWKVIFDLSWPAIIAMVLIGANNMLDAIFVGHFAEIAKAAVAGISLTYPLTMIALGLGSLIGVGAGSLLSIVLGAKQVSYILQAGKHRFTAAPFRLTAIEKSSSKLFRWECRALL